MSDKRMRGIFRSLNNFLTFFLIVAFVVTCCMVLFLDTMANEMGMEFTAEGIETAAKLTFLNVLLISAIISVCDLIRRRVMIDAPAKKITEATKKMMKGDFSARVELKKVYDSEDPFAQIAGCINSMAEELSSTETLRSDFIANVSHEIKTPLAIMNNYATLMQDPHLSAEERAEYARSIGEASRRLSSLVTNILKLNKLENQQIAPKLDKFDLSEQLCECLLQFEDMWERKEISIETDIDDGVIVCSDRDMMMLVWNNLISNAIKFTESGGTVAVSLKETAHHVEVSVKDTGKGISPDVGSHIFDKFYQADPSRSTEGNGLGLSLVKRIMDITKNTISVESRPGKGSTFTVRMRKNNNE